MGDRELVRRDIRELVLSVAEAAQGLHGQPLGFSHFIRRLPDRTLQAVPHSDSLLIMITLHAKLIFDGDPKKTGVNEDFFNEKTTGDIRYLLSLEHLRRIAILRVRYPRDPFSEVAEFAWWLKHPMVKILWRLPEADREKLEAYILRTSDLKILFGHTLLLSDEEMGKVADECEAIDKKIPQLLHEVESEYGDSQKLAYAAEGAMDSE